MAWYKEARLMHPALAVILEARGDDWFYEACLGGTRKRVDFLVFGEHVDSLMDCKLELNPNKDIEQLNGYHSIYGKPSARKVIVTTNKVYKHAIIRQYTEAGITIMRLNVENVPMSNYDPCSDDVRALFPHRIYRNADLTEEKLEAIRLSYDGKHGSITRLAEEHGLSMNIMQLIVRGHFSRHDDYALPRPLPSQETSI
jgi:hypothetical protein